MNINIKDVNVLERLLPNQHSSKEMAYKQVDAGFKSVYENRLQQNNNTASARLEKQKEMPEERVKAKLENAFEKKEAFGSRVKEKKNEFERVATLEGRAKEANGLDKSSDLPTEKGTKQVEPSNEKPVATETVKAKDTEVTDEVKETEETEETEQATAVEETKSPLTTFMQMILQAVEDMSTKLGALKDKMAQGGTLTPEVEGVIKQLEASIETLKSSLVAVNTTDTLETGVAPKFIEALKAIQTFDETVKNILKALPQTLKADLVDPANMDKAQQTSVVKGALQDIKEILKTPLTQVHVKPLLEKLEHVSGKAEKWIEQEIRKMMGASKNDTSIKGIDGVNQPDKGMKDAKIDIVLKTEGPQGDDKKAANATAGAVINGSNKTKGETADQRVVHLEQIGTPIDKQIVKIIEKNTESQSLFKSILTQVQESVKATLKVTSDSSEMVMKLKPESLGDVSVKITVHKNSVIAEMTVQSQIVKEALESSLMDLKSTLKDKGFDVSQINVNVGHEQQSKESRDPNHSQRQASRFNNNNLEAIGNELPDLGTVKTFIQNGKMDYFA